MTVCSIPTSWIQISVGDCGLTITGNTPPTKDPSNYGGKLPYIKPPQLNNCLVSNGDETLTESGARIARVLPINSILVSCIGNLGRTALNNVPVAFNQQINAIIPNNAVNAKYLFFQAQSSDFRNQLEEKATATTISIVNKGNFEKVKINLAPLKEQKRIVTKIEELFSELDNGIASLKIAQEKLKVYRQAVLKHAFEGKLTAQWREENKDKLETPEQLLARIQQEREARYQEQLAEWEKAVAKWEESGKEGKKPGKPKNLTLPQLPNTDGLELPVLPNEWIWVHPEHLMSTEPYSIGIGPFGSNLKVVDYRESGVPLIFVRNITRQNYVDELKFVDIGKAEELYAHQVHPLDLVITKMGDPPGDCDIYPENRPKAVLTADCLKFRLLDEFVDRYFYKYCINSNLIKKQLGLITKGVAQKKISVDRFKTIALPFPTLDEQIAISSVLSKIFECVDKTEQELLEQQAKLEILRQSILKKAFSGQLVPQDPSDEPARELLARIQAEKAAVQEQAKPAPMKRGRKVKEVNE